MDSIYVLCGRWAQCVKLCIGKKEFAETEIAAFLGKSSSPQFIESYIDFWKIATTLKKYALMAQISDTLAKLLQDKEVPNDLWIKSNIVLSKALVKVNTLPKYNDARTILQRLAQIMPPLPLPITTEYDSFHFAGNTEFPLSGPVPVVEAKTGSVNPEDLVRSVGLVNSTGNAEEAEEKVVRVSVLEYENKEVAEARDKVPMMPEMMRSSRAGPCRVPTVDYVKKPRHEKRMSAFQEHMTVKFDLARAVRGLGKLQAGKTRV